MPNNILLRAAARALLIYMEEIPVVGGIVRIGRQCWESIEDLLVHASHDKRISILEEASRCSEAETRQIVVEAIAELKSKGHVIKVELAEAVQDLVSTMPSLIRENTLTTLSHVERLSLSTNTVFTQRTQSERTEADRENFYAKMIPRLRPQFHAGDSVPNDNIEWRLKRMIGAGGFGEVWLAERQFLRRIQTRAIKFCLDANNATMHEREANTLDTLCSQLPAGTNHVVALLEVQLTAQPFWLAMEYVDGGTLEHRMRLGPMDWPTTWELFKPLLEGMMQVHKLGIVHRDLKPANILLAGGTQPRIADFGIGKILVEHTMLTMRGAGTPMYMSREQASSKKADPSDDVHALGIILWQMLSGKITYLEELAQIDAVDAPQNVKTIIRQCVFNRRGERPANAGELLKLLKPPGTVQDLKLLMQKRMSDWDRYLVDCNRPCLCWNTKPATDESRIYICFDIQRVTRLGINIGIYYDHPRTAGFVALRNEYIDLPTPACFKNWNLLYYTREEMYYRTILDINDFDVNILRQALEEWVSSLARIKVKLAIP